MIIANAWICAGFFKQTSATRNDLSFRDLNLLSTFPCALYFVFSSSADISVSFVARTKPQVSAVTAQKSFIVFNICINLI